MKWNRKKQQADQVNRYIDSRQAPAEIDAGTRQVVDSVRQTADQVRPSAQFVDNLSNRLQAAAQERPSPAARTWHFLSRWTPRLVGAGLAIALVVALVSWLPSLLPPQVSLEPGVDLDSITAADQLVFPSAPAELPMYQVIPLPVPDTPEAALVWAIEFGLPDPELFLTPGNNEVIVVIGRDERQLTFQSGHLSMIHYVSGVQMSQLSGDAPTFEAASEAAVNFLAAHNLLPDAYQMQDQGVRAAAYPVRNVAVWPELHGYRFESNFPAGTSLSVGPDGQIISATISQFTFAPRDQSVSIHPAQEVYDAFIAGAVTPFRRAGEPLDTTAGIRHFSPPPPEHAVGDAVELAGWVNYLVSPDGERVRATLHGATVQGQYRLVGPQLVDMVQDIRQQEQLHLRGVVVAMDGPAQWQVEVHQWEARPVFTGADRPPCLIGTFEQRDGEGWLRLDADDGRYHIPHAPDELAAGERIEVCLWLGAEAETDLNWAAITSPPASEVPPMSYSSSGMVVEEVQVVREVQTTIEESGASSVTVEEHVVEVEVAAPEPPEPLPTPAPLVPAPGGSQVEAAPSTFAPLFELGETVVLTGVLSGFIIPGRGDVPETAELNLQIQDEHGFTYRGYPLVGEEQLLLDSLRQHYQRYVTVTGVVTLAPEMRAGPDNHAIEVKSITLTWPEAQPRNFLGSISLETFDGVSALVFTDRETGQQYIVAWDVSADYELHPYMEGQQLVTGLIDPTRELAGLPVMQRLGSQSGSGIETAESAAEFPLDLQPPARSLMPPALERPGDGNIIVESMELVYYYQPQYDHQSATPGQPPQLAGEQIARPVWVIIARDAAGSTRYTFYLDADQS